MQTLGPASHKFARSPYNAPFSGPRMNRDLARVPACQMGFGQNPGNLVLAVSFEMGNGPPKENFGPGAPRDWKEPKIGNPLSAWGNPFKQPAQKSNPPGPYRNHPGFLAPFPLESPGFTTGHQMWKFAHKHQFPRIDRTFSKFPNRWMKRGWSLKVLGKEPRHNQESLAQCGSIFRLPAISTTGLPNLTLHRSSLVWSRPRRDSPLRLGTRTQTADWTPEIPFYQDAGRYRSNCIKNSSAKIGSRCAA